MTTHSSATCVHANSENCLRKADIRNHSNKKNGGMDDLPEVVALDEGEDEPDEAEDVEGEGDEAVVAHQEGQEVHLGRGGEYQETRGGR